MSKKKKCIKKERKYKDIIYILLILIYILYIIYVPSYRTGPSQFYILT
jgi:hypothetical protein